MENKGFFSLVKAVDTLLRKKVPPEKREIYAQIVKSESPKGVYYTKDEERNIMLLMLTIPKENLTTIVPWSKNNRFDLFFTISNIIQFYDEIGSDLLDYLFPAELINEYTQKILDLSNNPSLTQQFQIALELCNYMPIGAVYLLAITSRTNCRGLDHNLDGNFRNKEIIRLWYRKVNKFDFIQKESDCGGNLYYFWTHFFANLYLLTLEKEGLNLAKIFNQQLFRNGTKYMNLARRLFVRQPQMSNYDQSSYFGRKLGKIAFNILNN
ncbi:MAG: hypothetical protein Fur009_1970 [Candidatus Microgenomates bacterium]